MSRFSVLLPAAVAVLTLLPSAVFAQGMDLTIPGADQLPQIVDPAKTTPGAAGADSPADPNANPFDETFDRAINAYREEDFKAAREIWGELSDAGHGPSTHNVAVLNWWGKGGDRNPARALELFNEAANANVPESLHALGVLHLRGLGVPKDIAAAVGFFQRAADIGHPPALYNMAVAYLEGVGVDKDPPHGRELMEVAAEKGLVRAQYDFAGLL